MRKILYQIDRETQTDTNPVVSLTALKKHVAIDAAETYYDDMLTDMEAAAVEYIESRSRLILRNSSYEVYCDRFPEGRDPLYIPLWPIRTGAIDISYTDASGVSRTYTTAQKVILTSPASLYPAVGDEWPETQEDNVQAVSFSVNTGYVNNAAIPSMVKHAVKLLVAHWFRNRETVIVGSISKEIELALASLMVQFRKNYWTSFGVYQ